MDLSHVTTLVGNIAATAKTLCSSNDNSNDRIHAQQQMHVLATQLSRATADPAEVATKLMFQVPERAAMMSALRMGLFSAVPRDAGAAAMTTVELAAKTGGDRVLINRLMRALAAGGTFDEVAEETYKHNAVSLLYREELYPALSLFARMSFSIPSYLSSIAYANPAAQSSHPLNYATGVAGSMWEYFAQRPETQQSFATVMATLALPSVPFLDVYPLGEELSEQMVGDKEEVVLVDVGGAKGQILREVRSGLKEKVGGRWVLQDLPGVLEGLESEGGVEVMGYDYFTQQPVKGAYTYLFRWIMHDWPDEVNQKILANTVQAMTPGVSRLLICDAVLPDKGASAYQCALDMALMTIGGYERSEKQWRQMIEGVKGLKVKKVWRGPGNSLGIIETVCEDGRQGDEGKISVENIKREDSQWDSGMERKIAIESIQPRSENQMLRNDSLLGAVVISGEVSSDETAVKSPEIVWIEKDATPDDLPLDDPLEAKTGESEVEFVIVTSQAEDEVSAKADLAEKGILLEKLTKNDVPDNELPKGMVGREAIAQTRPIPEDAAHGQPIPTQADAKEYSPYVHSQLISTDNETKGVETVDTSESISNADRKGNGNLSDVSKRETNLPEKDMEVIEEQRNSAEVEDAQDENSNQIGQQQVDANPSGKEMVEEKTVAEDVCVPSKGTPDAVGG